MWSLLQLGVLAQGQVYSRPNCIRKLGLLENHSNIETNEIKPGACILISSFAVVTSVLLRKQIKAKQSGREFAQLILSFSHHVCNFKNKIAKIFRAVWIVWILTSFTHSIHVIRQTSDVPITTHNQLIVHIHKLSAPLHFSLKLSNLMQSTQTPGGKVAFYIIEKTKFK